MLAEYLHIAGDGLCHQIPDRTLVALGLYYPVCARCTGIYLGFVVALAVLFFLYRGAQRSGIPRWPFFIVAALASAGMLFDVVSAQLMFRDTSNLIRLATGTLFGASLGVIAYLMLVDALAAAASNRPVLGDVRGLTGWLTGALITVVVTYFVLPLAGPLGPILTAVSIVITFSAVATACVGLAPRFRRSVHSVRTAAAPSLIGLVLGAGGILLAKALQFGLERLAGIR